MDSEGCCHRPASTRCPAYEIEALRPELTEAQRRLKGWTKRPDEVLVSQKAIAAQPGTMKEPNGTPDARWRMHKR